MQQVPIRGMYTPPGLGFLPPMPLRPRLAAIAAPDAPVPDGRHLGQSSIGSPGFGGSLMFVAGGVGAFYFSEILPSPVNFAVKGLGIIAAGWGAYSLISSFGSTSSTDVKAKADLKPAPAMSAQAFEQVSGSIIGPAPGTKPEITTDGLFGPIGFNVQLIWRNDSSEPATFPYDILSYGSAAPGIPVEGKTWVQKIAYNSSINALGPRQQSPPLEVFIPLLQPPDKGPGFGYTPVYMMDLQLRKISTAKSAIAEGPLIRYGPFDFR